jgi:hypothetical protein
MSAIQIIKTNDTTHTNIGRYFMAEMQSGKHSVIVVVAPNYLQIVVQNASNRAWRGMGKHFPTLEVALAAYKTAEIRAMISHAVEMSKQTAAA